MSNRKVFWLAVITCASLLICFVLVSLRAQTPARHPLGIFEGHSSIGAGQASGSADYDSTKHSYTVTTGANATQFAWKKVVGDVALSSDVAFGHDTSNANEAVFLMFRQSLDAGSAFVAAAIQPDGSASLEYREAAGAPVHRIRTNISAPTRVRLEKRRGYAYLLLGANGGKLAPSGASIPVALEGSFYAGIALSAKGAMSPSQATFSEVGLDQIDPNATAPTLALYSSLETIDVESKDRTIVYFAPEHFEAPNWTRDGSTFLFNQEGRLYRLPVAGGTPVAIDTGFAIRCNNDHGISPDSNFIAISDQSQGDHDSRVYIVPFAGGAPRLVTPNGPSYWHGWSPDGKTLAFVGDRHDEYDIYTIPVAGGDETRLTTAKGLDDGPEYTPDGKYIYFNSVRTGLMQIWRMRPGGSDQEQITHDDYNNWFPHFSPDGKWMAMLSFDKSVVGHPPNQDVSLRLMSMSDGKITVLAKLFGGQGTINVPSWAPDSKHLAFVSYELLPAVVPSSSAH